MGQVAQVVVIGFGGTGGGLQCEDGVLNPTNFSKGATVDDLLKIEVIKAAAVLSQGTRAKLRDNVVLVLSMLRDEDVWKAPEGSQMQISPELLHRVRNR